MCHVRKTIKIAALLVGTMLFIRQASAEQPAVKLDDLIQELLRSNPAIQAAGIRAQAALTRPRQESALPDPVVAFVSKNASGVPIPFTTLGSDPLSSVGFMWVQEFPYPGKLKLAGQVAEKEAASTAADADSVKWATISELKQAYYDYFRTSRSLVILQESLDLLKRFENIAEARYAVGEAIQQDVLRAQLEISVLKQRTTSLEQEKAGAAAAINKLLNRPVDSPMPEPAEVLPSRLLEPLETLQQQSALRSPQVLSSGAMLEREKLSLDLAKKQKRPDFMTSVEYDNSPNYPDMWEIQFGVRIPLFYKRKQNLGITESAQNLARADKELAATRQEVAFNIQNEYLQIQSSEKLLALYQDAIIPQTNLTLESALASYQVGKADFLTMISNFLSVLEYRINYFEEVAKHESAVARLEAAVGHSLAPPSSEGGQSHE